MQLLRRRAARHPHHASQIRLSNLRDGGAGAGAGAADRRRPGDACAARPGAGQQISRPHTLVSAGRRSSPATESTFHVRGWPAGSAGLLVARGAARTSRQERVRVGPSVRRRHARAGARSRLGAHENGQTLDLCARTTNGHGADPIRRRWSSCSRPTARPNVRPRISGASRACCMSTAMPASSGWPPMETL